MSGAGLDEAKRTIEAYKRGQVERLTTEVWKAKKIVDSTLHPGTLALEPAMLQVQPSSS